MLSAFKQYVNAVAEGLIGFTGKTENKLREGIYTKLLVFYKQIFEEFNGDVSSADIFSTRSP